MQPQKMHLLFLLSLLILTLSRPLSCEAMPCHCFSDREYNPGQAAAADPYFLATAQNSFFATVFSMSKKKVVLAKQKPAATSAMLWVGYWVAEKASLEPKTVLRARYRSDSWINALEGLHIDAQLYGRKFHQALDAAAGDGLLSEIVVNELLRTYELATEADLELLRSAGADDPATILAAVLACKTGKSPLDSFLQVKAGETSWGRLLLEAGLDGGSMDEEIPRLIASPPQ